MGLEMEHLTALEIIALQEERKHKSRGHSSVKMGYDQARPKIHVGKVFFVFVFCFLFVLFVLFVCLFFVLFCLFVCLFFTIEQRR